MKERSSKIADDELASFATQEGGEARSVIVELSTTSASAIPVREPLTRADSDQKRTSGERSVRDIEGHAALMDNLEKALKRLRPPSDLVRLDAAQAFVVSLTPEQIRRVLAMPLVGLVRSNRTHRVPGRPSKH